MSYFYSPLKPQKIIGFLTFSGGCKNVTLDENGLRYLKINSNSKHYMKWVQEKDYSKIYILTRKEKFSYYYFNVFMTGSEYICICSWMEMELLYLLKVVGKEIRTTSFRSSLPNVYCKKAFIKAS